MTKEKAQASDGFEEIKHTKELAELKLDEAKTTQVIEGKQNQEIANYTEARDLANQLHGKVVVFSGVSDLFRGATLKVLREIRDNKLYKHVSIIDEQGNSSRCENFKDYCKYALKRSHTPIYEQLQSQDVFGDAVDALKGMGVERDDFRLLRKQDNDLHEEVKEAALNKDKNKILEIIDDLSSKHVKEKETLQKQLEEAENDKISKDDFLHEKTQKINELNKELDKYSSPSDEEQLKQNLESAVTNCESSIRQLGKAMNNIFYHAEGSEQLRMQPLNQFEFLLRELVDAGVKNELQFDAKKAFAPLMVMFEGFTPEQPK